MSKRSAANELNHDNWCEDEEPEAAGVFKRASADALKDRKFRTARRRGAAPAENDATNDSGDQGGSSSIFAGFSGFKKAEPASAKAVFSFLSATPNGSNSKTESESAVIASESTTSAGSEKKPVNGVDSVSDSTPKSNDYYRRLKGLNESVAKWISTHVSSNPLIILTPIFRDYEKHLASIQGKDDSKAISGITSIEGSKQDDGKKDSKGTVGQFSNSGITDKADAKPAEEKKSFGGSIFGSTSSSTSAATATFSFGSSGTATTTASPGQTGFCFGSPPAANTPASTFSFGSGSTTSPSAGFSFGAGKPFTFSNVASNTTEEKKEADNEEDDEDSPPKPDHKPVNEDGATYTKRCKVFIKKDKEYSDRGIGNLFLKPVDGGKVQLIVRADTSLGNVLLNILVGSSLPIQRIGTNNVAVVCLPTPESQPPPVTVLIRVKTKDDADELFNTLEKHKKEAA